MGGARTLQAACVAPSSIQKYLSIMSLETSSHPLFIGLTSVSSSGPVNLLSADLSFFSPCSLSSL